MIANPVEALGPVEAPGTAPVRTEVSMRALDSTWLLWPGPRRAARVTPGFDTAGGDPALGGRWGRWPGRDPATDPLAR